MSVNGISPPNAPITTSGLALSPSWYRFFVSLRKGATDAADGEVGTASGSGLEGGGAVSDGVDLAITANGVTSAMLRQSGACSVMGRYANSAGDVADIQATGDNRVLARIGGQLVFTANPVVDSMAVDAFSAGVRAITATATVATGDYFIEANATGGNITVNLPALETGRMIIVKKTDASANTVTLDGSGAETIDGAATNVITVQYAAIKIIGGATQWLII